MTCNSFRQFIVPTALILIAVLAGCVIGPNSPPPDNQLSRVVAACGAGVTEDWSQKLVLEYDKLKVKGEIGITAVRKTGIIIYEAFKDKPEIYTQYVKCIDKGITHFLSLDSRPRVAIVGSTEDYTTYNLPELTATSADLLDRDLRLSFQTKRILVTYGQDHEDELRGFNPAVVVIHASAFHDDRLKDESVNKFQAYIRSLYTMPKTRFLVFSRLPPDEPSPDLCKRWGRQVTFMTSNRLQDRLFFYPLAQTESNLTGKAGSEMRQIVRCFSGTEEDPFCSDYMAERKNEAQERIRESNCSRL